MIKVQKSAWKATWKPLLMTLLTLSMGFYEAFDKKDHLSAELFKISLISDIKFALMSKKELKDRINSYKDLINFMDSVFKDNDEDLIKELREAKAKEME